MAETLTGPRQPTIKRLFAVSGNQCAFPKCAQTLVDGETVTGKVCHIKGKKKGSARFDELQPVEERHGFDNLILMCGRHHDVIDDDEDAYTVERLVRMKTEHERTAIKIEESEAEHAATLIVNQQVSSTQQSGGITANVVHVHQYANSSKASPEVPQRTEAVTAKTGNGRFRAKDEPLGVHWNTIPFATDSGREIFLNEGPVLWVRMRSAGAAQHDFDNNELRRCIGSPNVPLQPLSWGNMHYLRAVDGVGMYAADDPLNLSSTTSSVAFAFSHGEVWATDTTLLGYSSKNLYFIEIVRIIASKFRGYAEFLSCLGLSGPFEWSIGVDDVKHWILQIPPPPNHISTSGGHRCLESHVIGRGTYEFGSPIAETLLPFLNRLCRTCATSIPSHLDQLIRTNGIR
jgi:hypothetical protein